MSSIDTIVRARSQSRWRAGAPAAMALLALVAACSSSSGGADGGGTKTDAGTICHYTAGPQTAPAATCTSPGGATAGAANDHCAMGGVPQVQAIGVCVGIPDADAAPPSRGDDAAFATSDAAGGDDAAAGDDAGDDSTANCGETGYGVTNLGTSAADDDCKYNVSWTSTPICENGNVYFTVTAKKRAGADGGVSLSDGPPLTGASVNAEVLHSDCVTLAPTSGQTTSEQSPGVYKVGPIVFSKSGMWNVRFHFNACCSDDLQDSPHGHAAFWVNVP